MNFELPRGEGSLIPADEALSAPPEQSAEGIDPQLTNDPSRYDMLDHLLRDFEQWGRGVQLRLQRQDEQSGQLEQQLARAKTELRGEAQEKDAHLRATLADLNSEFGRRLGDLNAELGRLRGEIAPLVTELTQLSSDRDRLKAEIQDAHDKLGKKASFGQVLVAAALLGVAGLGYLALPRLIGAFTALMAAVPV